MQLLPRAGSRQIQTLCLQEGVAWSQFVLELPLLVSNLAQIRAYFQYSLISYHDIIL